VYVTGLVLVAVFYWFGNPVYKYSYSWYKITWQKPCLFFKLPLWVAKNS